jgi:hypothetical protein
VFVPGRPFEPSRMSSGKARAYLSDSDAPLYSKFLALPTIIRLGWKGAPGTNTLAYYNSATIITFVNVLL